MDISVEKFSKEIKTVQEYDYSDLRITRYVNAVNMLINLFKFTYDLEDDPNIIAQKVIDNLPKPIQRKATCKYNLPYSVDVPRVDKQTIRTEILAHAIFYLSPIACKYMKEPDMWDGPNADYRFWESFLFAIEDGIFVQLEEIRQNISSRAYGGFKKSTQKAPIKKWVYKRAKEIHTKNKALNNREIAYKIFREEYEPDKWDVPLKTDAEFNTIYRWVLDALKK